MIRPRELERGLLSLGVDNRGYFKTQGKYLGGAMKRSPQNGCLDFAEPLAKPTGGVGLGFKKEDERMKAKIVYMALALVLVFSLAAVVVPAGPALADTTTTLTLPSNVYRPAEFVVSSTTTHDGLAYTNVLFVITVSGPESFAAYDRTDVFTITEVDGGDPQGISGTFVHQGDDFVGYWGPLGGFPLPASYSATTPFTIEMNNDGTAPLGTYNLKVELVNLSPDPDEQLTEATGSFSLSGDTLYVGAGQQFTTIQAAVDAASSGDTINVAAGTYPENLNVNKGVSIVGAGVSLVTIDVTGKDVGGEGIHVTADGVSLEGFTLDSDPANGPNYGIKCANVVGVSLTDLLVTNLKKTGFDLLGINASTVSNVASISNGGHGIQVLDCNDVTFSDITVSGNSWQGISVATWGLYSLLGTSGIVFSGTNSFVDDFQLEEGDYNNPGVPLAGDAIITYSTNPADGADVTVLASDFGYAMHGEQDDSAVPQNRIWFFQTLAEAQATAASAPVGHFTGGCMYIESLTDSTQLYVSPGCSIQCAVDAASSGDTINVAAGTYDVPPILFDKSLTITGADPSEKPLLRLSENCRGSSGEQAGWFRIDGAYNVNLSNLILDGDDNSKKTCYAIGVRNGATGTFQNNVIRDIFMDGAHGCGISTRCDITVQDNTFQNIERIGISVNMDATTLACLIKGNTIIGQGIGYEMCEYGIEVDFGGTATVEGNTVYNYCGVASDGSESSALYVNSYYYGTYGHSKAVVKDNVLYDSTTGLFIGNAYAGQEGDQTEVTATGNQINDNEYGIYIEHAKSLTANNNNIAGNTEYGIFSEYGVLVDATNNWWGDASGPEDATAVPDACALTLDNPAGLGDEVSECVDYSSWLSAPYVAPTPTPTPTPPAPACFIATAAYGTSSAAEIDVLRAFRDEVLLESTLGSQLVEMYYQTSPPVADFISENSLLRTIVRELVIDPIVSVATFTQDIWGK